MTTAPALDLSSSVRRSARLRHWQRPVALLAALGLAIGLLVSFAALTTGGAGSESAPRPSQEVPASADGTERWLSAVTADGDVTGSADAIERHAITASEAQRTRCIGTSADAVERCVASG
jgi:hypothetical protein